MNFSNLKIKKITNILRHTPSMKQWRVTNRTTHIIGIQLKGVMFHEIGDREITLTENSLFFFNKKDDFHAVVKKLGVSFTIHFTSYEDIDTPSFAVKTTNSAQTVALLERIERLHRLDKTTDNLSVSYFYHLCQLIDDLPLHGYRPKNERIERAKEYMQLHFKEKDALRQASELSGFSRRRFNDLFKIQYGLSPNRFLTSLKINYSKELLFSNGLSMKQIAEMSGFDDAYYFSKVFKTQTGLSPTQYKKQ